MSKNIPVISPDGIFKLIWDIIMIIIFLFLFLSYPIQISFNLQRLIISSYLPDSDIFSIEFFIAIFYGINVLIKLDLAYFDRGLLVTQKYKIIQNYIKTEIFCDFLGFVPILLGAYLQFNPNSPLKELQILVGLLIFSKILEVRKTTRFLEETLHLNDKNFAILQLIKLVITIFVFSNIMACLWHLTSYYSSLENQLKMQNYYEKEWQSRYLRCLFWTVNPGRVDPQNNLEQFFGFFALLATSGSMGFMISGIHNLMRVLGKSSEQKR